MAAQDSSRNSRVIVTQSKAMNDVLDLVDRLAQFPTTVLITGESGTGKELIARRIHELSMRRSGPFIAINCGAIPITLVESELFGHKKGAFTDATRDKAGLFEEANGGTIFLDEIGELPLLLQVKLLRALQEQKIRRVGDEELRPIDVRVIAATLRDLEQDVKEGKFRDDLYYRLNVVSLHIPPLRERPEDIQVLVSHFIGKQNKRLHLSIEGISEEALDTLRKHDWPGNVRELENCIEHAMVLSSEKILSSDALPDSVLVGHGASGSRKPASQSSDSLSIKERTKELEIELITRALERTKGNRTHAAKILEISHRALLYKIKEYNLT